MLCMLWLSYTALTVSCMDFFLSLATEKTGKENSLQGQDLNIFGWGFLHPQFGVQLQFVSAEKVRLWCGAI